MNVASSAHTVPGVRKNKKPAMSSHGRSHHSLCATQGARIRVERVIASISDCLRRQPGRPREASPNYQGPGTKRPAIVCHGRSHHLLRVAQGARIRVDASSHPYSVVPAERASGLPSCQAFSRLSAGLQRGRHVPEHRFFMSTVRILADKSTVRNPCLWFDSRRKANRPLSIRERTVADRNTASDSRH